MASNTRKQAHQFRLSYAHEVGSSLDPDMEDVTRWENEVAGMTWPTYRCPMI